MNQSTITAAAAVKQSLNMDDTEKRQLRAYVNISTGDLAAEILTDGIPWWRIPVIIENSGFTQTRMATSELWCVRKDFAGDDPMKSDSSGPVKRFLGPKQKLWAGTCNYSPDDFAGARNSAYHLFIASKVIYKDTIDREDTHITENCIELVGIKGEFSKVGIGNNIEFRACDFHNCADDECPKEDAK